MSPFKWKGIVNKSLGTHLLSRRTWLGGRGGIITGWERRMKIWRNGQKTNRKTRRGIKTWEKKKNMREKWLCARSWRRFGLFACVCSCCASLHVPVCQHSIISEKNWIVLESGWLMKSTAASLLGHCLEMSHSSDKNPLYHATPCLGVTQMKYEHSI